MKLEYFISHIKVTGPYLNKKQGRKFATLFDTPSNRRTQKTYAKYLMEIYLQRELLPEETVDHIDRNSLNDVIENLRIISQSEHAKQDNVRVKSVNFICPICHANFKSFARKARSQRNQGFAGPFCSASCLGKYGKQVQDTGQKLPIQEYIESEYYYPDKNDSPTN